LKSTSGEEYYCVDDYNDYVPEEVINAEEKYKTLYFDKYKQDNATLTIAMIQVIYINFKCNKQIFEQDQIKKHLKDVHGARIAIMKPIQEINVDKKLEFSLPDIMDIELAGPDSKRLKINSIFTRSVKSAVVTKTNNKKTADLMEDQSQVFMVELGKSTPTKFFSRFEMYLRMALEGEDIRSDFTCKWWVIEKALFKAISKEQNTIRYAHFLEKDYTQFHSLPMEILINSVDAHVYGVLGKSMKVFTDAKQRTLCNYIYSIKKKHELIFDIARHLGDNFKVIRQYISEKCTTMHDDTEKILDISELQEDFKKVFEDKGVLTQYTSENIPAPKKGTLSVSETKIKNDGKKLNPADRPVATKEQIREINVDKSLEFKLPGIMDIELAGPDSRGLQINSIFTRSVKSGVVTKTNNKKTADLMEDQSQVFMTELGKSTPVKFFSRFEMFIRMAFKGRTYGATSRANGG
jgi:hypothetical protein